MGLAGTLVYVDALGLVGGDFEADPAKNRNTRAKLARVICLDETRRADAAIVAIITTSESRTHIVTLIGRLTEINAQITLVRVETLVVIIARFMRAV